MWYKIFFRIYNITTQVVQTVEKILYAQNDEDAKHVISQAQLTLLSQLSLEEGGGPLPPQTNGAP